MALWCRHPAVTKAFSRRDILSLGAAALLPQMAGCRCASGNPKGSGLPSAHEDPFAGPSQNPIVAPWHRLSFEPSATYPERELALISVPEGAPDLPLVIALHGRGETRSLEAGAHGFRDDYGVDRVDGRLRAPPITSEDLLQFTNETRLQQINATLQNSPYKGVVLTCPYAPDLKDRSPEGSEPYGRFITEQLLPAARAKAKMPSIAEKTGIDGVSMGGRLALWIGFRFPEMFGAVSAMQPALRVDEAKKVADLAKRARDRNPKLRFRLLSSEGDPFLAAVRRTSEQMRNAGVDHDLTVVPGPHNYEWNRGPGCLELLLWQERALRGLPSF